MCFDNHEKNGINFTEAKNIKNCIYFFETLSCTMDKAREFARNGAQDFSVVVAEKQTQGRGRLDRKWISERGGLWFTIILRPNLPPSLAFNLNFAASLSLTRTINKMYRLDVTVKWPNDILLNQGYTKNKQPASVLTVEKKLAGLLSEMETQEDIVSFVNIGIGINVNNNPEIDEPNSVSIKNALGESVSKYDLLSVFLDEFRRELIHLEPIEMNSSDLIRRWKKISSTIGRDVRIRTIDHVYEGLAVDVDETGALILIQEDGKQKRVIYGDCFHANLS